MCRFHALNSNVPIICASSLCSLTFFFFVTKLTSYSCTRPSIYKSTQDPCCSCSQASLASDSNLHYYVTTIRPRLLHPYHFLFLDWMPYQSSHVLNWMTHWSQHFQVIKTTWPQNQHPHMGHVLKLHPCRTLYTLRHVNRLLQLWNRGITHCSGCSNTMVHVYWFVALLLWTHV